MTASTTPLLDTESIRREFPILQTVIHDDYPLVYLDNAASTQRPRAVIDRTVEVYEKLYANVHRGVHWLSEQSTDLYEEAREKVRAFVNAATTNEIIFTTGATLAINLVARSWGDENIQADDEIVVTIMEHHSNIVPWQQLGERTGCRIVFAPIHDDGQLDMAGLAKCITPKTRIIAASAVSNVTGVINPIAEIVRLARGVGALVVVDAAQSAPHTATDVQAMGADFVAFSGHKMLAPSGVGVLYGREELLEAMPPFLGGGSMIREVTVDGFTWADLPAKFEAGTPPIVPALGLGAAIDYLQSIGLERIEEHERALARRAHEVLDAVGGIRILGPDPDKKAGIVSFVVDGIHAHDVGYLLDRRGVAVRAGHHCAMPLHERFAVVASNRASFYLYNTMEEVDALGEGLEYVKSKFRRRSRKSR